MAQYLSTSTPYDSFIAAKDIVLVMPKVSGRLIICRFKSHKHL